MITFSSGRGPPCRLYFAFVCMLRNNVNMDTAVWTICVQWIEEKKEMLFGKMQSCECRRNGKQRKDFDQKLKMILFVVCGFRNNRRIGLIVWVNKWIGLGSVRWWYSFYIDRSILTHIGKRLQRAIKRTKRCKMIWFLCTSDGQQNAALRSYTKTIPSGVIQIVRYITGLSHDFATIAICEQYG